MRKNIVTKLFISMMLLVAAITLPSSDAKASVGYHTEVPLVTVKDIGNVPYPSTTPLYFFGKDFRNYSKFTITDPGEVKAYFTWGVSTKNKNKNKGTAWFSRDEYGYDIVGDMVELSRNENSLTAFLDDGTYYLNCVWADETFEVGAALLYENAKTEERVAVSSFDNSNFIELDKTMRGFLTHTAPNDYYIFSLEDRAMVEIKFSFDKSNAGSRDEGLATLYDKSHIELARKIYDRRSQGAESINILLEPGIYYVKLSGIYGVTTLNIDPMYYDIELKPEVTEGWTKGPMKVTINTTIDYKEMIVVNKRVYEDDAEDRELWRKSVKNENYVPLEGNTFEATKNGYYTVRVEDKFGNYEIKTVRITTMDTTAPKVTGVSDGKAYKKSVTIKWSDSQSGINTKKVTLNGKKVKSGIKVTEPGKYTLKVYDKVGNVNTVKFYIDFTAPTVTGVSNGKTYTDTRTVSFKDNLSGIKRITVNGEDIRVDSKNVRYRTKGTYVIRLWDNAGNSRKVTFHIK